MRLTQVPSFFYPKNVVDSRTHFCALERVASHPCRKKSGRANFSNLVAHCARRQGDSALELCLPPCFSVSATECACSYSTLPF